MIVRAWKKRNKNTSLEINDCFISFYIYPHFFVVVKKLSLHSCGIKTTRRKLHEEYFKVGHSFFSQLQ